MNSLKFIENEIKYEKENIKLWTPKKETSARLNQLQQIKTELEVKETANELKKLLGLGVVFLPREFYDDYESCLRGDGSATFVTKDLKLIDDFSEGWKLLEEAVDDYNFLLHNDCKIAFVIWFNR